MVQEIQLLGCRSLSIVSSVSNQVDVAAMFEQIKVQFGGLDILANNAGITCDGFLLKMTEDQWDQLMDVNLNGVFNCCQCAARMMSGSGMVKSSISPSPLHRWGTSGKSITLPAKVV